MQELNLYSCTGLSKFPPIEEGAFPQLVILNLSYCGHLRELPNGFTSKGAFPALRVGILYFINYYVLFCEGRCIEIYIPNK